MSATTATAAATAATLELTNGGQRTSARAAAARTAATNRAAEQPGRIARLRAWVAERRGLRSVEVRTTTATRRPGTVDDLQRRESLAARSMFESSFGL